MATEYELDEIDMAILKAMKEIGEPARPKEIAARAGLDARRVAAKMRKLRRLGLVEKVAEGVYRLTEKGANTIEQETSA